MAHRQRIDDLVPPAEGFGMYDVDVCDLEPEQADVEPPALLQVLGDHVGNDSSDIHHPTMPDGRRGPTEVAGQGDWRLVG